MIGRRPTQTGTDNKDRIPYRLGIVIATGIGDRLNSLGIFVRYNAYEEIICVFSS